MSNNNSWDPGILEFSLIFLIALFVGTAAFLRELQQDITSKVSSDNKSRCLYWCQLALRFAVKISGAFIGSFVAAGVALLLYPPAVYLFAWLGGATGWALPDKMREALLEHVSFDLFKLIGWK
jgi:hypothetical protein